MSTPQRRYEHAMDARMDKDLAEGFHSYCEKCGANIDNETGDFCQDCQKQQEEEKHDEQL